MDILQDGEISMCEYCENIKVVDDKEELDYCLSECIVYETQSGKHWIITKNWVYDWDDCLDIEFCPMCGRKLSEVTEMANNETYINILQGKLRNLRIRCHESARDAFDNGNYGILHIVTADELKNDDKVKELQYELEKTYNQLMEVEKEAQERIAELESELEVKEDLLKIKNGLCGNNDELPIDPMEVAQMLINSTYEYELSDLEKALYKCGDTRTTERYSIDDLEQIAEHLLVYCKHNKNSEE